MATEHRFLNPPTLGQTPIIEAYRIGHCPTCDWPAVSVVESADGRGRRIDCRCGRGHPWATIWSGGTKLIHRRPFR